MRSLDHCSNVFKYRCRNWSSLSFMSITWRELFSGLLLEPRQYKNESFQSKTIPTLKLPRFYTTYRVAIQFQNWKNVLLNGVVLILSLLYERLHGYLSNKSKSYLIPIFNKDVLFWYCTEYILHRLCSSHCKNKSKLCISCLFKKRKK